MAPAPLGHALEYLGSVLAQRGPMAVPYSEDVKYNIRQHMSELLKMFPALCIRTSEFHTPDGRVLNLLKAGGTIPIHFQNHKYNIPIVVWLPERYPRCAPLVYVTPTPNMVIKQGHSFVDASGQVLSPYITHWQFPQGDLSSLAQEMAMLFGSEPPLYSKPPGHTPPPPPPPHMQPPAHMVGMPPGYPPPGQMPGVGYPPPPNLMAPHPHFPGGLPGMPPQGGPGPMQGYPPPVVHQQQQQLQQQQQQPQQQGGMQPPPGGQPPPSGLWGSAYGAQPPLGGPPGGAAPPRPQGPPAQGPGFAAPAGPGSSSGAAAAPGAAPGGGGAQGAAGPPGGATASPGGGGGGGGSGLPRRAEDAFRSLAVRALALRLQAAVDAYNRRSAAEMERLLEVQRTLSQRERDLSHLVSSIQQERAGTEGLVAELGAKCTALEQWLEANEWKLDRLKGAGDVLDMNKVVVPADDLHRQALAAQAEDLAVEAALGVLDQALAGGKLAGDAYLKAVRLLARRQFFARTKAMKIAAMLRPAGSGGVQRHG